MWTARTVKSLPDFHDLLTQRYKALLLGDTAKAKLITAQIEKRFRKTKSPLIIDLTGFSTATRVAGTVQAMSVIRLYWDALHPVVNKHHGKIIKDEGDTFYALFDTAAEAVLAAMEMEDVIALLRKTNDLNAIFGWSPESSIGIGFGAILDIDGDDAFGSEVNYAYNAGEVVAGPNEILLTEQATLSIGIVLPKRVKALKKRNLGNYSLWQVERI